MPACPRVVPGSAADLYQDYSAWLARRDMGEGTRNYLPSARKFLTEFPDPQRWAVVPLAERLAASCYLRPLLTFLMLHGHLRPGYDYLLERKLSSVLTEGKLSPMADELKHFLQAAQVLGYSERVSTGMATEVAVRLLIETSKSLVELTDDDRAALDSAIEDREHRHQRRYQHYRTACYASWTVIYHLGARVTLNAKRPGCASRDFHGSLAGVTDGLRHSMVAYLERRAATLARSTVQSITGELACFGRFLNSIDPELATFANLDRRRHIDPYLNEVANALNHRSGERIAACTQRSRIQAVGHMLEAMSEWGWEEAPSRKLIFGRDSPRPPRPLPRYLPPDDDHRLVEALEASPHRLRADALLLARATGVRIGELVDLELDCVHEVPSQGAWLKVPLGKLATERMVPLDDDTVELIDRIAAHRSPGRPLRHPRDGRLVEFLLTSQGRRIPAGALRLELRRAAEEAGLGPIVPHQLRHTYVISPGVLVSLTTRLAA